MPLHVGYYRDDLPRGSAGYLIMGGKHDVRHIGHNRCAQTKRAWFNGGNQHCLTIALPWDIVPIDPDKPYDSAFQQIMVVLL